MKSILSVIAVLAIVGCAEYTGNTTNNDNSGQDHSFMFVEGDRSYGSGTYLFCTDANCSVIDSSDNSYDGNGSVPDAIVGDYNSAYNQVECTSAGFFWCTVDDKCLNQRVDDSSSSCN